MTAGTEKLQVLKRGYGTDSEPVPSRSGSAPSSPKRKNNAITLVEDSLRFILFKNRMHWKSARNNRPWWLNFWSISSEWVIRKISYSNFAVPVQITQFRRISKLNKMVIFNRMHFNLCPFMICICFFYLWYDTISKKLFFFHSTSHRAYMNFQLILNFSIWTNCNLLNLIWD